MKVPNLHLTRRSGVIAAATALVVGVGGWAFAEGEVPLVSSSPPGSTSTTPASSTGGNGDNVAVATNTKDAKTVVALSIKIVKTDDPVVDPVNAAVAVASCTDCQTVAIALEGVLVMGDPTTFDPTNIALALNHDCTNCQTLASAHQTIVQSDGKVKISGAGRHQIAEIRKDLNSLKHSGLDIVDIRARINDAAGQFLAVLHNEVYPAGKAKDAAEPATTTTTPAAPGSSTPATTATTAPPPPTTTAPPTTAASTTTTTP